MTFDAVLIEPTQIWLEFSQSDQTQAWQQSQSFSGSSSRWNAYLNQLCLNAVLPWFREEYAPRVQIWPLGAALSSIWEVVNGTAITLDATRFLLVPTETIDLCELRVPQEWVDIPSWAADYYLAVQVNPDDGGVMVWGYTTHQQLKERGQYDGCDRAYSLSSDDLILDLNALWVARQLCPEEKNRAEITPLTNLSQEHAENLLQRLGNPAIVLPRLAVPFQFWGALLEHGGWRQCLYERRLGLPEQRSILQWLRTGVSDFAQKIGWEKMKFQPSVVGVRGVESTGCEAILSRRLAIAGQQYELRVIPSNLDKGIWRFELRNTSLGGLIPGGFKLRLLTEDLQAFENNEDVATTAQEQLYIEVALAPGEGLVWETEPLPENYDREILRF